MIYSEKEVGRAVEYFLREVNGEEPKKFLSGIWAKFFGQTKTHIIGLSGNLGAGKTTFTKHLLTHLGYSGAVPSPTFVLRRDYETSNQVYKKVIHIDAYRLEKPENIYQVISKEELADNGNLVLIEWPEKTHKEIVQVTFVFEHISENERKIVKI